LEQQINYLNKNNPQTQIEDLQQKLQKVSGDLDIQQHKADQLEKQVNDFYTDLDQRLKNKPAATENSDTATAPTTNKNKSKAAKKQLASVDSEQKNTTPTKNGKKASKAIANDEQTPKVSVAKVTEDTDTSSTYTANTVNPSDSPAPTNADVSVSKKESALKEQEAYQKALDDLRNKQFTAGAQKLKTYLTAYPNGIYAANSHYWLGEIYFLNNSYAKSSTEFDMVVTKYASSPKIPEALFKLAYIHDKEGKHDQAQKEYRALKKRYPNSSAATLADHQLQQTTTTTN
jgi:tol-pal system protein YbgF